jgi:putative phosphoribosyl transferase
MPKEKRPPIIELPELRNRIRVYQDRSAAGEVLAGMLEAYRKSVALVLAVPAGGVAVGSVIAKELSLSLDLAVVSKITLPWNPEVGYGAVAFDGTVILNQEFLSRLNLSQQEIQQGIRNTEQKVTRRMKIFRGDRPLPDFGKPIILVDDGLASGFTLLTALKALRKSGCQQITLAVPTGHEKSLERIAGEVERVYCPNLRSGPSFAVADAYEQWSDLDEEGVIEILKGFEAEPTL